MDRQNMGLFILELRKEKHLTQKELAAQLNITDKAVSKWERGLSMPDITLLIPLSEALGVTVTELLECRRIEPAAQLNTEQTENLLKKAISLSAEDFPRIRKPKAKNGIVYAVCLTTAWMEIMFLFMLGYSVNQLIQNLLTVELLSTIFGAYFFLFAKERLPAYYDENKIDYYTDGFFRMHLPGVSFNNKNWGHIVRIGRLWTMVILLAFPLVYLAVSSWFPDIWTQFSLVFVLTISLGGLLIPIYVAATKYQ